MKALLGSDARIGVPGRGARALRFGMVGLSGVVANLAALHLFAAVLRLPEVASSALAIEASIVWNFLWHDTFTFRDRRGTAGGRLARLARYHAVSAVSALVQLATFVLAGWTLARAIGRTELGALRYLAQGTGIAVAFAWSFAASTRFAWAPRRLGPSHRMAGDEPPPYLALAVFGVVLVLHVLPIWLVEYFPTQDGPLHVENVLALMRHSASPLLQRWYEANWGAQPNWLTQAILALLLQAFSPVVAEKIVLTGYTVLFPLSFRTVLPRGSRGWWGALAAFPFVHAFPFHMGFWNFCYGLALALLAVGIWGRARGRLGVGRFAALAAVAVLLFLAHTVAFAGAAVALAASLAWRAGLSLRRARGSPDRRRRVLRGYALRAGTAVLAAAPGLALAAAWVFAHRGQSTWRVPFLELAAKLAVGYSLVSIDRRELFLGPLVVLALFVGVVHLLLARSTRGPRLRPNDAWLVAAVAFGVLYFAVPDVVAAGAHVSDRLALFALVSVAIWIGTGAVPFASQRRAAVSLAAIALVALGVRFEKQVEISAYIAEFVSAKEAVERERVLLPLAMTPVGPRGDSGYGLGYRVKPFLHATGWIVAERGGVDLKNSQANTDHCPVRFPTDRNPFRTIAASTSRMESTPPCIDLRVPQTASIDYVLLWGATREALQTPCGGALAMELTQAFEPVFISEPHGMLEVWRPRTITASR